MRVENCFFNFQLSTLNMIEPIIFFDMAAAIFILSVTLAGVVFYLSHVIKKLHSLKDSEDAPDSARQKGVKMIDDANNKALDIINKVTLSSDAASEIFKEEVSRVSSLRVKEFEKTTADFIKIYFQILQDLKTKNIEVFQDISKDIEIHTTKEIENFRESMQKLTSLSQGEVKRKIDFDYANSLKEIENYKKEELQKIDQEIYEFLEKISKLVLGKALSISEHEKLIEKSLEKAKKEGIFK